MIRATSRGGLLSGLNDDFHVGSVQAPAAAAPRPTIGAGRGSQCRATFPPGNPRVPKRVRSIAPSRQAAPIPKRLRPQPGLERQRYLETLQLQIITPEMVTAWRPESRGRIRPSPSRFGIAFARIATDTPRADARVGSQTATILGANRRAFCNIQAFAKP